MTQPTRHILEGTTVLDFTQVLAGPSMTHALAQMGAEVIKVEFPGGEISRHLPFVRDGWSGYFIQQNRGKKSLCVDLKHPAGRQIVQDLAARADVVVESFTPGVINRLGFGYEEVRRRNPSVVMCSISAFGQQGPLAMEPGFDYIAQAYSGVSSMVGDQDGAPVLVGVAVGDVLTGANALSAVVAALLHRERTGEGQWIDAALIDAYLNAHEINVQAVSGSRGVVQPRSSGRHHPTVCPLGIFEVKGEYILIAAAAEHMWRQVCKAMERPELETDPRFVDHPARIEHLEEVVKIIEGWLDGFATPAEAVAALQQERVPVAPILSVSDAMAHPHMRARGTVRTIHDRIWGDVDVPGPMLRFSGFPEPLPLQAPFLGEHNEDVLERHLGMSTSDVRRLERDGVLFRDVPDAAA